jgi:hypothetical protein
MPGLEIANVGSGVAGLIGPGRAVWAKKMFVGAGTLCRAIGTTPTGERNLPSRPPNTSVAPPAANACRGDAIAADDCCGDAIAAKAVCVRPASNDMIERRVCDEKDSNAEPTKNTVSMELCKRFSLRSNWLIDGIMTNYAAFCLRLQDDQSRSLSRIASLTIG